LPRLSIREYKYIKYKRDLKERIFRGGKKEIYISLRERA
jgi:hypothetical protein